MEQCYYMYTMYLGHTCARRESPVWAPWAPWPGPLPPAPRWPRTRTPRRPGTTRKSRWTPTGVRWPATTWRPRGACGRYCWSARNALRWSRLVIATRSAGDWLTARRRGVAPWGRRWRRPFGTRTRPSVQPPTSTPIPDHRYPPRHPRSPTCTRAPPPFRPVTPRRSKVPPWRANHRSPRVTPSSQSCPMAPTKLEPHSRVSGGQRCSSKNEQKKKNRHKSVCFPKRARTISLVHGKIL